MQGFVEIRSFFQHVIHARQPEPAPVSLDRGGLIRQDLTSLAAKRIRHSAGICDRVMIPHYSPQAMWGPHFRQHLRARFGERGRFGVATNGWCRDKIAGQYDQVRTQAIDDAHRSFDGMDRKYWVVVEIAEQRDGESV